MHFIKRNSARINGNNVSILSLELDDQRFFSVYVAGVGYLFQPEHIDGNTDLCVSAIELDLDDDPAYEMSFYQIQTRDQAISLALKWVSENA